ncbi:hypothetical protein [Pedobacter sp. BMA]|uniref:hypothetical protein n=1 Tax=Pedobacter sp. BMA TaxID=1663685 RepID=UPI0012E0548E|nr:hypothetical protein [Pedobacter sp. BMA]
MLFLTILETIDASKRLGIPDQLLNVGTGLAPDLVTLWSGTIVTSPTNPRLKPDRTVTQG